MILLQDVPWEESSEKNEKEARRLLNGGKIMTGYQALANAIIAQAARDYRTALRIQKRHPDSRAALSEIRRLERFFRSNWYSVLTNLNPEYLIAMLRKEMTSNDS